MSKEKDNKKIMKVLGNVAVIGGVSYLSYKMLSNTLFEKLFRRNDKEIVINSDDLNWYEKANKKTVSIRSLDGLMLNGVVVNNNPGSSFVLFCPDHNSGHKSMLSIGKGFDKLGYNLLFIDPRCTGESEGEYITYGQKEGLDIICWINYLVELFPESNVVLYGKGMGASSIIYSMNSKLPSNIKLLIDEAGYSDISKFLKAYINKYYGIAFGSAIVKLLEKKVYDSLGFNFKDISLFSILNSNQIPVCFVDYTDDEAVTGEAKILYNANIGTAKYYPISNKKHDSNKYSEDYFDNLDKLIKTL